ncbi:MAG: sigma-70 family RNA polymerase sigma factor, partial [Bacteroidetes bacterium]|nr:sigma-70 family RNA polymerase sigma factor [Bacteroidota bacterium]
MDSSEPLEELCRRLKASDRGAFEQVFRRLREGLLRYVRSIVERDAVAHDLVQDVFVYLWSLRETLDPSRPLKAYLYRMARNRAYRFLRDERAHAAKHAILKRQTSAQTPGSEEQDARIDAAGLSQRL